MTVRHYLVCLRYVVWCGFVVSVVLAGLLGSLVPMGALAEVSQIIGVGLAAVWGLALLLVGAIVVFWIAALIVEAVVDWVRR